MGRICGWLVVGPASHQSITELAAALQSSKASISTVIRQLEQAQMVERVPVPGSRQHHYRLKPGGWAQVLRSRVARLQPGIDAAEYGLSIIGDDRPEQRERLHELRDFFDFVQARTARSTCVAGRTTASGPATSVRQSAMTDLLASDRRTPMGRTVYIGAEPLRTCRGVGELANRQQPSPNDDHRAR